MFLCHFTQAPYLVPLAGVACGARLYRERAMAVGVVRWTRRRRLCLSTRSAAGTTRLAPVQSNTEWDADADANANANASAGALPQTATDSATASSPSFTTGSKKCPACLRASRGAGLLSRIGLAAPSILSPDRAALLRTFATPHASASAL